MEKQKVIGILLLIFAIYTIVGMAINDAIYWGIYNYVTLIFSVISSVVLLRKK